MVVGSWPNGIDALQVAVVIDDPISKVVYEALMVGSRLTIAMVDVLTASYSFVLSCLFHDLVSIAIELSLVDLKNGSDCM